MFNGQRKRETQGPETGAWIILLLDQRRAGPSSRFSLWVMGDHFVSCPVLKKGVDGVLLFYR
jgi:hypothetical protein